MRHATDLKDGFAARNNILSSLPYQRLGPHCVAGNRSIQMVLVEQGTTLVTLDQLGPTRVVLLAPPSMCNGLTSHSLAWLRV